MATKFKSSATIVPLGQAAGTIAIPAASPGVLSGSERHWMLDAGYWMLDTGCWMLDDAL